jgi:hypothetical protein
MANKQIRCHPHENVFQAFARAVKTGELPPDAKLFPLKQGVSAPEAPDGYVTVGSVLIRPREAFAVGIPAAATPAFEVGESSAQKPVT